MKNYVVWETVGASVIVGKYRAGNKEAALRMAEDDREANWNPQLCHQCANEIELGEVYETQVEEE